MPDATIGRKRWAIAEGYIPGWSHGPEPEMISHEALCFLNAGPEAAHGEIWAYFKDRDPAGPYRFTVPPRRTLHLRMNDLKDPEPIPVATEYACVVECDAPLVVQHTRLDSRQEANALPSTIAFADQA